MLSCDELRTMLENALRPLAGTAQEQIDELERQFGDGDLVDELALELDRLVGVMTTNEWAQACVIPREQEAILRVHRLLGKMSGRTNAALWTQDALYASPEWTEVRQLAKRALSVMGLPRQTFG